MNVAAPSETYPVGSLDHFFLNDDTDECPAVFFVRMTFDGRFDRDPFEQAVGLALARHPLMRAFLRGRSTQARHRLAYTTAVAPPCIRWARIGEPYVYPDGRTRIDLSREYGFRLFVHEGVDESVLVLQLHHAIVDGTGALMFLEDLLAFYDALAHPGAPAPRLRPLDPAKLHSRDEFHQTPDTLRVRRRLDLAGAVRLVTWSPHPLHGGARTMRRGAMPAPTSVWHEFDRGQFIAMRAQARSLGGTLNDYLLWSLFRALATWNRDRDQRKTPKLRVGMPVNLRQAEDADVPACNIVGMYFLDRAGDVLNDDAALYKSIVEETKRVRTDQLGLSFVRLWRAVGAVPGGIALIVKPKPLLSNCVDTVDLSNLGPAMSASPLMHEDGTIRAGALTLKRLELLPPCRYMTHASFGVASYDGRMTITLHYNARFVEHDTAGAFMQAFVERAAEAVGH